MVFFEVLGDITSTGGNLFNKVKSGCIYHLGYNGVVTATPAYLTRGNNAGITKIYVGDGSSQAADQAVLDQYLADSDWAAYASKLDLWYNYVQSSGEYATPPTIPTA